MSNLLEFPMSCQAERRLVSIASFNRTEYERLPPDKRMSAYLIQLTVGLGRLHETARRIDELSETLPDGAFKDSFDLFRLDIILRIKGVKAEVERMTAVYLAALTTNND